MQGVRGYDRESDPQANRDVMRCVTINSDGQYREKQNQEFQMTVADSQSSDEFSEASDE